MTPAFLPGHRVRSGDLNDLAQVADSAHLGGAGFLSADNGAEQVVRNPRRFPTGASAGRGDIVPAVVLGCTAGVYRVELYGAGLFSDPTEEADLVLTETHMRAELPAGSVVLAHRVRLMLADVRAKALEEPTP